MPDVTDVIQPPAHLLSMRELTKYGTGTFTKYGTCKSMANHIFYECAHPNSHLNLIYGSNVMLIQCLKVFLDQDRNVFLFRFNSFLEKNED
jgi:hypothetical protein